MIVIALFFIGLFALGAVGAYYSRKEPTDEAKRIFKL